MAVSVTITQKAFGDSRIEFLGTLLGYKSPRREALGAMALLWSICTERQTDQPTSGEIKACLGIGGSEALIESELGELLADGQIRVRGCEGLIEWYADVTTNAAKGGKARAASAPRDARGRLIAARSDQSESSSGSPAAIQRPTSPTPAVIQPVTSRSPAGIQPNPAQVQDQGSVQEQEPDPEGRDPEIRKAPAGVAVPYVMPVLGRLVHATWDYAAATHTELRKALEPTAIGWSAMPGSDVGKLLADRVRSVIGPDVGKPVDFDACLARCKHVVDVFAVEARRDRAEAHPLQWFRVSHMFKAAQFDSAAEKSLELASKPRKAPGLPVARGKEVGPPLETLEAQARAEKRRTRERLDALPERGERPDSDLIRRALLGLTPDQPLPTTHDVIEAL